MLFKSEHMENGMTIIRFCVFTDSQFQFNLIIYSVARDQITWKLWGLISLVMRYNLISLCSDPSWQPSRSGLLRWQRVVANLVCTAVLSDGSADGIRLFSQSMFSVAARPSLQMQVLLRVGRLQYQKRNKFFNRNSCWPSKYWSYTWPSNHNKVFIQKGRKSWAQFSSLASLEE